MWEIDIGMKKPKKYANINRLNQLIHKSIDIMQNKAERELNPRKYPLSKETKKRLKWIYIIHFEYHGNIAKAARKIGISRLYKKTQTWKKYLNKQRKRLANSRKIKNKEKINKLMRQIDKKLANSYK